MASFLIVGSSTGIGSALSRQLIVEGHKVYGTFNKTNVNKEGFEEFQQLNVLDDALDLSFIPDILDGLVYCPGAVNLKPFARIKPEDFISKIL